MRLPGAGGVCSTNISMATTVRGLGRAIRRLDGVGGRFGSLTGEGEGDYVNRRKRGSGSRWGSLRGLAIVSSIAPAWEAMAGDLKGGIVCIDPSC